MSEKDRLKALAKMIAGELGRAPEKPKLRIIDLPQRDVRDVGLDPITKELHLRRIRYLAGAYRLQWLIDQALFGHANLEDLPDEELLQLHRDMDRARECPEFDVSYEERGLVRNRA